MNKYYFVLGTGRSGTYSIYNSLKNYPDVLCEHEFDFENLLKLGTLKFHNLISREVIIKELNNYKIKIDNLLNKKKIFIDISNALPLLIDELKIVFPNSKIFWVSRNGYKVVSSFYFKFNELMYPDNGRQILSNFLKNDIKNPPKKSKLIWRPLYCDNENQLVRLINICYHWEHYENISITKNNLIDFKIKFENLISDKNKLSLFFKKFDFDFKKIDISFFDKPSNVQVPKNFKFNDKEFKCFNDICGTTMTKLDYFNQYYEVSY